MATKKKTEPTEATPETPTKNERKFIGGSTNQKDTEPSETQSLSSDGVLRDSSGNLIDKMGNKLYPGKPLLTEQVAPRSVVLGDVVLYTLKGDDAAAINRRRTDGASIGDRLFKGMWHPGAQAHIGEPVAEGDTVPMTVTKIEPQDFSECLLSGQCTLNGTDSYWVRKAAPGDGPGLGKFAR